MQRRQLLLAGAAALVLPAARAQSTAPSDGQLLVIGHAGVPRVDAATVARLYSGRAIEAGQVAVTVLNLAVGHPLRSRFLAACLQTDEERYRAYWTVRRHVGKGAPPREVASVAEMVDFVSRTPGALGYIDAGSATPGLNVVCRL
jgi:CTP:molybdopterin cytidylyltransferase MocA